MFGNLFNRLFPPPRFLVAASFGVDISDESIKFLELRPKKNKLCVGRYGERKILPGIIKSGKIKDSQKLQEALILLRKEEDIRSVRVSLPEEQVYLFKLHLDKSGLKNVREAIELELEEHIPVPSEDAIFDYEVLGETPQILSIQVAAIPQNVIEGYLNVFKGAEIAVKSFELEAQAIARSVVKKGDCGTYMIVDFGQKRTGIFIVSLEVVMFTSTLDVGGVMLGEMIAKNFKVSFEEAEKMKRQFGLRRNVENKEIFPVLLNSVSILRDEVVKHFLYWHTHKNEEGRDNPPISKIILCGGDSNLIGLSDYLSISLKTKVEMGNVWINVMDREETVPEISFRQALSFAAAIGLALGDVE